MKFSRFRRWSFVGMFALSVLFCATVVFLLQRDLSHWKDSAAVGNRYLNALHDAQTQWANTGNDLAHFLKSNDPLERERFSKGLDLLQRRFLSMLLSEQPLRRTPFLSREEFERPLRRMHSALAVLESPGVDELLANEAVGVLTDDYALTGRLIQSVVRYEFSNAGTSALSASALAADVLPMVVLYLVVMSAFLIAASYGGNALLEEALRQISAGTRRLSKGEFSFRFAKTDRNDELESVMADFNHMAERLEQQSATIRRNHEALISATERLVEANRHKDRFLANMSHELRTPLNAVMGFAELLRDRADRMDPERLKRYADQILSASEHLLSLISDLLEVARIDAGVRAPEFSCFDLEACISNTVTMLKPLADRKNLVLTWQKSGTACMVKADRRFVCQILINLMNNALKFTHEGEVRVRLESDAERVRIAVEDTGIGIPEAEQSRIFEDFHRVESNLSANYEGAGLGLTLTKRLVAFHNGTIQVNSTLGEGSAFTVEWPRDPDINERII